MEDKQIIQLYFSRSENAIFETQKKYGKYCYKIALNILQTMEDSEECVNDTYLHTWNAIPPRKPNNFKVFLGKITRNLSLDRLKKYAAVKRGGGEVSLSLDELDMCIPDRMTVETVLDHKALIASLNIFLADLSPEARKIFLKRYWEFSSVKEICSAYGITDSKAKTSLRRTREKLKHFLDQEGYYL